jgi:YggT family protein
MRYILTKVIYGAFALAELFLGLRFILKLFGANASNGFVNWLYEMSGAILDPFRGIFPTQVFQSSFVIEFSTLFAIIIYGLIAMLLVYIIELLTPRRSTTHKK